MTSEKWLISSDLDGTLLTPDGTVNDRTRNTLIQVAEKGHVLTLASGRYWQNMMDIAHDLGIDCQIIASNGGWIGQADGSTYAFQALPLDVLTRVESILADTESAVIVSTDQTRILLKSGHPKRLKMHRWPHASVHDLEGQSIYKVTVSVAEEFQGEMLERVRQAVGEVANVVRSDPWTIDVNALGISKGQALTRLTAQLGIPMERTIAFGNEMNDALMLKMAGIGVAVADANPDLFPYADARTFASHEDGVARWLEDHFGDLS